MELTESERSLIESGAVSYRDVAEGRRKLAEAVAAEAEESAEARLWDETHCPVCGADVRREPDHCR